MLLIISIIMLFTMAVIGGAMALVILQKQSTGGGAAPGLPGPGLPLPLLKPKDPLRQPPWNISWKSEFTDSRLATQGDALKVTYPAGGYGSEHGIGIRAEPFKKLPADQAVFSVQVYVPPDFQFGGKVHGGKFPVGFCIGKKSGDCASGGSYEKDSGSVRFMWRENGQMVAYVYPPASSDEEALQKQGPGVKKVTHTTGSGLDLWRKVSPAGALKKGAWNTLYLKVSMNTPGKTNGIIEIGVNGTVRKVTDAYLRPTSDIKIQHVFVSSFFGGGADYAPTKNVSLLFKDFRFSN